MAMMIKTALCPQQAIDRVELRGGGRARGGGARGRAAARDAPRRRQQRQAARHGALVAASGTGSALPGSEPSMSLWNTLFIYLIVI